MGVGRSDISHQTSIAVAVAPDDAFAFMCNPEALGRWALGCLSLERDGPEGVYAGRSIFDGSRAWLHLDPDPARRLVDYHVGTREARAPRISARVTPHGQGSAITLSAWRTPEMDDARWERLCRTHELEILIIEAHCTEWAARRTG